MGGDYPRRRGDSPIIFGRADGRLKRNHKFSIKEVDKILDACAWYPGNGPARAWLRTTWGIDASLETFRHYREARPDEIRRRYEDRMAALRGAAVPLAQPMNRLKEHWAQYRVIVRQLFREPCRACVGKGEVMVPVPKKLRARDPDGPATHPAVCSRCGGHGWAYPQGVKIVLEALEGDVRLDTVLSVTGLADRLATHADPALMDRLLRLQELIREELGDHWSPKESGAVPDAPAAGRDMVVVLTGDKAAYIQQLRALRGELVAVGVGGDGDGAGHGVEPRAGGDPGVEGEP